MDNISDRDRLIQYLRQKAEQQNTEAADLEAVQQDIANKQATVGMLEGGSTITNAAFGVKNDPNAYATAKTANQQMLTDYLNKKKAERNLEWDKFQAVKELADLEQAKQRADIAKKREDRMEKYQLDSLGLGKERLELSKKKHELDLNKFGWNQDMKEVDRARKVGKALVDIGEPEFTSAAGRVQSRLADFDRDIPGRGRLGSVFPTWINSDEAQQFKADVQALLTPIRKGYYGSALTATELKNFEDMTATGRGYSEAAFKYALNTLIQDKQRAIDSVKAQDPKGYNLYETQRSGGFVKAPESATQQQMPTQKKTRVFDPATGQWKS